MRVVQTLALWACSTLLGGCGWLDWVVGNEDTEVRCDHVWQFGPLIRPAIGADPRIWVRVRDEDIEAGKVRVLSTRVRQALGELGWTVDDARLPGITWLDLSIRFWGACPVHDRGQSAFAKVLRAHDPSILAVGEEARGIELGPRRVLTPGVSLISDRLWTLVEYVLVLDVHLREALGREQKRTLLVWARRVDLDEQEADIQISRQVKAALTQVFLQSEPLPLGGAEVPGTRSLSQRTRIEREHVEAAFRGNQGGLRRLVEARVVAGHAGSELQRLPSVTAVPHTGGPVMAAAQQGFTVARERQGAYAQPVRSEGKDGLAGRVGGVVNADRPVIPTGGEALAIR